jgi:hypothetical protein
MSAPALPPDPRAEHARQVLAGYDKGKWTAEVNLIGHLAGAVRQLLTLIEDYESNEADRATSHVAHGTGGVWLTPADAEVLGQALDDAIGWRTSEDECPSCQSRALDLCAEHAEDVRLHVAYLALARSLGIEVPQ